MIIALTKDTNENYNYIVCDTMQDFIQATFAPIEIIDTYDTNNINAYKKYDYMSISGKKLTKRDKIKEYLRNFAYAFQDSFYNGYDWSYSELSEIQSFFEEYGRRYGLLKEFRENAII